MAIDSPLLRQLRQREQENLRIAAELKQKRLQIEAEIAATFPPARHVGKSAIHAWWQRQKPGNK
jgi:hypothetical protein